MAGAVAPARPGPHDGRRTAAVFETERPRLVGLAYRMLGSRHDAEDVVQDAWLRWERTAGDAAPDGPHPVDNPAAWLTTTVARLALDRLRVRRRERERYVGPWLPEPVVLADLPDAAAADPAERAVRSESLTFGFVHLLERLSPRERVAFVLSEVFDEPHARVGEVVGASPTASRQLASRARRKLAAERSEGGRPVAGERTASPLAAVEAFVAACASGDTAQLVRVLAPDVVLVSDGGADVHAARRPVVGADRVARLLAFVTRRVPAGAAVAFEAVNGATAIVVRGGGHGHARMVVVPELAGDLVRRIRIVLAPAKLRGLDRPLDAR